MGSRGISSMKSIDCGQLELGEACRRQNARSSSAELVAGVDAVGRLDDRLDLLAPVVVGDAEHGDVGDLRVREQHALDLGRVDVHAARDDHVGLAVAEEQVAVLVEVADVADGEEACRGGSGSVLSSSLSTRSRPSPCACRRCRSRRRGSSLPSSSRMHDLARSATALPTVPGLLEPLLGGDDRAAALGGGVVLVRSTGPHHSSICRLTSSGHGAAAWTMCRSDDTSYFARTSSGSASSRWNCVGTMWRVGDLVAVDQLRASPRASTCP